MASEAPVRRCEPGPSRARAARSLRRLRPALPCEAAAPDPSCGARYCPEVLVVLDLRSVEGAQASHSCTLESGTVRITSVSESRVRGEFSGAGTCVSAPGVPDLEQFRVRDGRFDVVLIEAQG